MSMSKADYERMKRKYDRKCRKCRGEGRRKQRIPRRDGDRVVLVECDCWKDMEESDAE